MSSNREDLEPEAIEAEALVAGMLQDMVKRLIAAEKIVLDLAKHDPNVDSLKTNVWPISVLIGKARKYVAKEMLHGVGIKKLVKSWGN